MSSIIKALVSIASFNDKRAEDVYNKTGSYGHFDEPVSVRLARETIKGIRRWRHKRRGTVYLEIGSATGQCSAEDGKDDPMIEGRTFMVYYSAYDEKLHVRLHDEFLDGRFEGMINGD